MIISNQKQKRLVDKTYLKYIRDQPCLINNLDCIGDVVYHHTISVGAGGSDYFAVPLCHFHHIPGVHSMGSVTFQDVHEIDFNDEIIRLLNAYQEKNRNILELLERLEA